VASMSEGRLSELGIKLATGAEAVDSAADISAEAQERLNGVESEAKQRLWVWTLGAILVLVAAESLLGMWRRKGATTVG
jgi:hypothetical protein